MKYPKLTKKQKNAYLDYIIIKAVELKSEHGFKLLKLVIFKEGSQADLEKIEKKAKALADYVGRFE